jgi:hypothetical protein
MSRMITENNFVIHHETFSVNVFETSGSFVCLMYISVAQKTFMQVRK